MSNRKTITVLLIEDDPEFAELVESWLLDDGSSSFALSWKDTLAAGLRRLKEGGVDIVLLDLGLRDSTGAATFSTLKESAAATPVIVLSVGNGEVLALEMIREGAEDYLVKSTCTAEALTRAVRYAMSRHGSRAERSAGSGPAGNGKAVGVIGSKGGVGTTTVAWSLAADLGQQTGEKILVCDLDFDTGMIAFLAGVASEFSIQDATENISRLDQSFWQKIVQHGSGGVDVLAAPRFYPPIKPEAKAISEVLVRIRRFYGWIVLDLGRQSKDATLVAETVDELLLVTTTAIPSLYEAKRFFGSLSQTAIDHDRVRLVVNELDKAQHLSREDLTSVFGSPVCGVLPAAWAELHKAALERRLPHESSSFRKEMVRIARKVANLPELTPKRSMTPFFSRKKQEEGTRA